MTQSSGKSDPLFISQQKFGRYQVVKLLGEGAMGRVYLASDPVLDRLVALKVIALDRTVESQTRTEFFERFSTEARASARLNHPSIVTIHDAGEDDGVPWIAFEYVKGVRLDQFSRNEGKISFKKIRTIITQLCSALQYAHDLSIVHRDIKPQNILIDERTHVAKLADFGVAKAPWAGLTREGNSVGSPGYMSPEQIEGSAIDARSDLFSLGIVIYEMITGKHPFLKDTIPATFYATLNCAYIPVQELRPDTPQNFIAVVNGLLLADQTMRIQSASKVLSLLDSTPTVQTRVTQSSKNDISKEKKDNGPLLNDIGTLTVRILLTLAQKAGSAFSYIYKNGLRPSGLAALKFTLANRVVLIKVAVVLFPLCFIPFVLQPSCNFGKKSVRVKADSYVRSVTDGVNDFFSENKFDSIESVISSQIELHGVNNEMLVVKARIALKRQRYSDALEAFQEIVQNRGYALINRQKKYLLSDIEGCFQDGEASEDLISICAKPLRDIFNPVINEWLEHSHYWVRWNTVAVCNEINRKVDLVNVYLLDLKTAASLRTRIKAIEKLGEIGDRRAVKPLQELSGRGFRDPFVAAAATEVLERYFK